MTNTIETNEVLSLSNEVADQTGIVADTTATETPVARKPRKRSKRVASAAEVVTVSKQRLAALKAHRTRLIATRKGVRGKARAEMQARIDRLTAEIDSAVVDQDSILRASAIALVAHRTRTEAKLKGSRGKARKALQAKIEAYDEKVADWMQAA